MRDDLGKTLGRYEVQGYIDGGGIADVYKGYHPGLSQSVALKVLKPERSADPTFVDAFVDEAKMAAQLSHPNIVTIFDIGQQDAAHYIVMEYAPGGTLRERIRSQGGLPPRVTCELFDQIAEALNYAHRRGFVHCDVKPSNILLDGEGRAKLTDFGIARAISQAKPEKKTKRHIGSPRYMSPEHVQGRHLDHRSDIYALGVVLFEMLTGRAPFERGSSSQVMHAHVTQRPPLPSSLNPAVPAEADRVVMRALAKNPDARYQNALQMARDLRKALLPGTKPLSPPPRESPEEPQLPAPPRRLPWPLLGVVAVAILVAAAAMAMRQRGGEKPTATPTSTRTPTVVPTLSSVPTSTRTVEILLPTSTSTGALPPTSTLVPPATRVPPSATPTVAPTQTQPPQPVAPVAPSAPALQAPPDGASISTETIALRWRWDRALNQDEHFDVRVWREGETPHGITWTDQTSYDVRGLPAGKYFWSILVLRETGTRPDGSKAWEAVSEESETRSFTYSPPGPPAPTAPSAPTATRTPKVEPTQMPTATRTPRM